MPETIDRNRLIAMLQGAVAQIQSHHEHLSRLDSFGGDGDHGTTMLRVAAGVQKMLDTASSSSMKDLLSGIGWAVMGVDGGATGPLLGMFFTGMSQAVASDELLDAAALAAMFEAGLASVRAQTKAQVGDKTVIDALVPGVQAMRKAADQGADVAAALAQAADAAEQGARSTEALVPRFGRARHAGEQAVGHADAGATSVSMIFRGFSEGIPTHA